MFSWYYAVLYATYDVETV